MIPKSKIRLSRSLRAQTTPYPNLQKLYKRALLVLLVVLILGIYGYARNANTPNSQVTDENTKQILGDQQEPGSFRVYEVNEGDTLFNISTRYGLNWEEVAKLNELKEPYTLKIGQELKLPQ